LRGFRTGLDATHLLAAHHKAKYIRKLPHQVGPEGWFPLCRTTDDQPCRVARLPLKVKDPRTENRGFGGCVVGRGGGRAEQDEGAARHDLVHVEARVALRAEPDGVAGGHVLKLRQDAVRAVDIAPDNVLKRIGAVQTTSPLTLLDDPRPEGGGRSIDRDCAGEADLDGVSSSPGKRRATSSGVAPQLRIQRLSSGDRGISAAICSAPPMLSMISRAE